MSTELDAVLGAYYREDSTRTRDSLLWELRSGDRTRLAHAAYVVATRGMNDSRGMPTTSMQDRIDAQQELLERIAPELDAMEDQAGAAADFTGWGA